MPGLFDIRAATNTVVLGDDGSAEACFTATNVSGRSIHRVRADIEVIYGGAEASRWLSLVGEPEREFAVAATEQYTIQIRVPPGSSAGSYTFRLNLVDVDNTDEGFSHGQPVIIAVPTADVPEPSVPALPFRWWWIGAAAVALLVVVGVLLWAFVFSKTTMPKVTGDPVQTAQAKVEQANLMVGETVELVEPLATAGEVLFSTPPADTRVGRNATVGLVVALAPTATPTSTPTATATPTPSRLHFDRDVEIEDSLTVGGNVVVSGDVDVNGPVNVNSDFNIRREYQVYWLGAKINEGLRTRSLGQWDLCALASYEVAGENDPPDEWGKCLILPEKAPEWGDFTLSLLPGERVAWTMKAQANEFVDWVNCQAICINFG